MNTIRRPWAAAILVWLLIGSLNGCGGSAIKKDTQQLKKKCDVVRGNPVSEEQARCIAKLFGIEDEKSCPMEVDRPETFGQPVYRVRESCNGLGAIVAESSGRVLAIVSGDEILH